MPHVSPVATVFGPSKTTPSLPHCTRRTASASSSRNKDSLISYVKKETLLAKLGSILVSLGKYLHFLFSFQWLCGAKTAQEKNAQSANFREEQRSLQRHKETIMQMVHDLRTLAHIIQGSAEALQDPLSAQDQQQYVRTISDASSTLSGIIDDSLLIARYEHNKVVLKNENFSLPDIFQQIQENFAPACKDKDIQLIFSPLPDEMPDILYADKTKLLRILLNLVSNAIKYNKIGGSVTLTVSIEDEARERLKRQEPIEAFQIRISIKDTGTGLTKDDIDKLFRPYSRSPNTSHVEGTGLGLVTSRLLATVMQGGIAVRSQHGKGSTFTISFQAQLAQKAHHITTLRGQLIDRSQVRILMAEDNKANQKILLRLLNKLGFNKVTIANDGGEALQMLQEHTYDIVLMDKQMPVHQGDAVTRIYRQEEKRRGEKRVPILLLSAEHDEAVIRQCTEAGIDAFLSKPYKQAGLEKILLKHLTIAS